jgi:hypothetical protein
LIFSGAPRRLQHFPPAASAATQAVIELMSLAVMQGRLDELPTAAPEATYLALAPFIGTDSAAAIISAAR